MQDDKLKITELFMAKAGKHGWDRCFHGTIKRDFDGDGNPFVYGKINVLNGFIYATAEDQWVLGEILDELVLMILEFGFHADAGRTTIIAGKPYFMN